MTTASRLGGIKQGPKGATLALRLQNKNDIREDMRMNGIFVANLSTALNSMPKHILGALASQALYEVMVHTHQESSRAAANWNLSVSSAGLSTKLNPWQYNQSGPTWGQIGEKGDWGSFSESVIDYKLMYWGIGDVGGNWLQALPGGLLHESLGIGKAGNVKIELFNPILGDVQQRRAGGDHTGNTYAYYAFEGATGDTFVPGLEKVRDSIGNGFIPWLLIHLNQQVQRDSAAGRIMKL